MKTEGEKKPESCNEVPESSKEKKTECGKQKEAASRDIADLFIHLPGSRAFFEAMEKHHPKTLAELQELLGATAEVVVPEEREHKPTAETVVPEERDKDNSIFKIEDSEFGYAISRSLTMLQGYIAGSGDSPESLDEAVLRLLTMAFDIAQGNISPGYVRDAMRAGSYERDVAAARVEGVVEGRNTRISQLMEQEERGNNAIPRLAPSVGTQRRQESIFTLAKGAR